MKIVSIGEAMVELAQTNTPGTYALGYAGDTLNTAWYLRQLRPTWDVGYLTAVGADAHSDALVAFMASEGLTTTGVQRDPARTLGLYMISLDQGERSFAYWRGQSAARRLASDPALLDAALDGADLAYLSGITLAILEDDGRRTLLDALSRARANGTRVAFDTNLRPRLWPDAETMRDAVTEAGRHADILLPSYEDEATFFGDTSPEDTLARWRTSPAQSIVVKNGGGGILFGTPNESGTITPDPVDQVVDTTAAGDSFNAGVFAELLTGQSLEMAIRKGCEVAGHVIQSHGALVPLA